MYIKKLLSCLPIGVDHYKFIECYLFKKSGYLSGVVFQYAFWDGEVSKYTLPILQWALMIQV